ncbi:MAG: hypothetical protein IT340_01220 [Chloroflexi bacterium]|nr:hypothetical protein [Chloroflexota bacterium]
MGWRDWLSRLLPRGRRHRDILSFDQELKAAGGLAGRNDRGIQTVPTEKIVGSVSRWQNLRSDFFYRSGEVTARFQRVGQAMRDGKILPPLELYKLKPRRTVGGEQRDVTEYYVVDGHHRVAMARKLGQDYLDAHVVEHRAAGPAASPPAAPPAEPPTTPAVDATTRSPAADAPPS